MTSRETDGPLDIQFSIDDRPGVLRPADISAALGLCIPPRNSEGYRAWAHSPGQREEPTTEAASLDVLAAAAAASDPPPPQQ